MDNKVYTIVLADETIIDNLTECGNNFVSKVPLNAELFEGKCSPVIIDDGEHTETHPNMELIQVQKMEHDEYWFILRDIPASKLEKMKMRSDIEYLAMMTDVEL